MDAFTQASSKASETAITMDRVSQLVASLVSSFYGGGSGWKTVDLSGTGNVRDESRPPGIVDDSHSKGPTGQDFDAEKGDRADFSHVAEFRVLRQPGSAECGPSYAIIDGPAGDGSHSSVRLLPLDPRSESSRLLDSVLSVTTSDDWVALKKVGGVGGAVSSLLAALSRLDGIEGDGGFAEVLRISARSTQGPRSVTDVGVEGDDRGEEGDSDTKGLRALWQDLWEGRYTSYAAGQEWLMRSVGGDVQLLEVTGSDVEGFMARGLGWKLRELCKAKEDTKGVPEDLFEPFDPADQLWVHPRSTMFEKRAGEYAVRVAVCEGA